MRTQSSCTEKCLLGDERSNGKAYKKDEFVVEFLWWHVIKLISLDGIPLGNFPTESIDHESLSLQTCVCACVCAMLNDHFYTVTSIKNSHRNATTEKFFRFFMFYPQQIDYSFSVIAVVVVVFFCHHHHHHHHQKSTPSVPKQISL